MRSLFMVLLLLSFSVVSLAHEARTEPVKPSGKVSIGTSQSLSEGQPRHAPSPPTASALPGDEKAGHSYMVPYVLAADLIFLLGASLVVVRQRARPRVATV